MAGPQEILVGRYARRLQRLFSMKGDAPVTDVAPELIAVVDAQGGRLEDFYLADERLCVGLGQAAANAGFRSEVELRNPVSSGILVIVERVVYNASAATNLNVRVSTLPAFDIVAQLATTKFWRDTRIGAGLPGGLGNPAGILAADNTRVLVAAGLIAMISSTIPNDPVSWVLSPGAGLTFEPGADNLGINVTLYWRERPFEPSEA